MRTMSCLLLFVSIPGMAVAENAKTTPCPIVPVPKEYNASGKTIVLPERNQEVSIVLGEKCTEADERTRNACSRSALLLSDGGAHACGFVWAARKTPHGRSCSWGAHPFPPRPSSLGMTTA